MKNHTAVLIQQDHISGIGFSLTFDIDSKTAEEICGANVDCYRKFNPPVIAIINDLQFHIVGAGKHRVGVTGIPSVVTGKYHFLLRGIPVPYTPDGKGE